MEGAVAVAKKDANGVSAVFISTKGDGEIRISVGIEISQRRNTGSDRRARAGAVGDGVLERSIANATA